MKTLIQFIRKIYRIMSTDKKTKTFSIKITIIMIYYCIAMAFMFKEIQLNLKNMDYVLDVVLDMSALTLLASMGFIISTFKKSKVYKLLDVLSDDLFLYSSPFSKHQLTVKSRAARHATRLVYFIISITSTGIIMKTLPTLFFLLENRDHINPGQRMNFPLKCWFPFDIDSKLKYFSAFTYVILFTIVSVCYMLTGSIFVASIVYTRKELKVLTVTLQELDGRSEFLQMQERLMYSRDKSCNRIQPLEYYLHVCMKEIIQHHNKIIRLVEEINHIFGTIYFMIAQTDCIALTLCAYNLSNVPISFNSQFLNLAGLWLAILFDFGMTSWMGQSLINEDQKFRHALYNCNWTNKPKSIRKTLIVMMERTKRPLCVRIGKIYILNYKMFTIIVNAAYSYYNLLRTVRSKENK